MTIQKRRKKRATLAEKKTAAALGGRRTFLSGAGDEKGDGVVPHGMKIEDGVLSETTLFAFRIEQKTTRSDSYTLNSQDWEKILVPAEKAGQAPLFVMEIGIGTVTDYAKFVAIRTNLFTELTGWDPPLATKDIGRNSLKVKRGVRTDGWGAGNIPCRRIYLKVHNPTTLKRSLSRKGDLTILAFDDLLRLVKHAEETWK
jgi:hypothetical protein